MIWMGGSLAGERSYFVQIGESQFDWLNEREGDSEDKVILINFQGGMADHEDVDSIDQQMEYFLRAVARRTPTPSAPICLRVDYKNQLKVTDKNKRSFNVDESVLSPFRDTYTDKNYKTVRLANWEFEIDFEGKHCKRISMIADTVIFHGKSLRKEITGCHFKLVIAAEEEIRKFNPEITGYLNRLGKRHLCSYSQNIDKEKPSLVSFIPLEEHKQPTFQFKPWVRPGSQDLDPLTTINNEGKKILEKLRHFISRQQVYDYILEEGVSETAITELKRIALGR